ncbi:GEVED domain-containing protein [Bizionia sp. KMM 8389]
MRKTTYYLCVIFCLVFTTHGMAQTLNQNANWPNANWTLTGTDAGETDTSILEANPTIDANFAFDDDDAGGSGDNDIAAESPVIDLTAAHTAGETWLTVSADVVYRYLDDLLVIQYYDADASAWVNWGMDPVPGTSGAPFDDFCSGTYEAYETDVLNIAGFTATQLSNFKYRIFYDDSASGGSGWEYGFCFQSPTIVSQTPPACPAPLALSAGNFMTDSAELSWTEGGTATAWDIELLDVTSGEVVSGTPTDSGVSNPYVATGLVSGNNYEYYVRAVCSETSLSEWSGPFAFIHIAAPANDDCDSPISLTVNADLECGTVTAATTFGATASSEGTTGASGTPNTDVWFSFEATSVVHRVSFLNRTSAEGSPSTSIDMGMVIYEASSGCDNLVFFGTSDPEEYNVSGLTVGNTYYVRAYGWNSLVQYINFDVCVGTPPPPPANDECMNAVSITASADETCTNSVSGTTASATLSSDYDCSNYYNDVWYKFTPTTTGEFNVIRTLTSGTSSTYLSIYEGSCGSLTRINSSCYSTSLSEDLVAGTPYYISVATYNSGETSFDLCVYASPTCYVPDDFTATFVAPNSVDFTWEEPNDGTTPVSYNWEVVPQGNAQGAGVIDSGNVLTTSATATGLTEGVLYDLYVQSDCDSGDLSSWGGPYTFNAGYCLPSGSSDLSYIDGFTTTGAYTNIDNSGSGFAAGNYGNYYASHSVVLAADQSFDFTVVSEGGSVGCAIWIDWNNDFAFDETTETVYNTTGYNSGPFDGTITVPAGTADGDYVLRVMTDWNDSNPSDDACGLNNGRGEVEDYKVTVDASLSRDTFAQLAFDYYPNPVTNTLTLKAQQNIQDVAVFNMLGQKVLSKVPNTLTSELDMSSLQSGAYFVKVMVANNTETIRIVKN